MNQGPSLLSGGLFLFNTRLLGYNAVNMNDYSL